MTRMVNVKGEYLFEKYEFDHLSIEERVKFLEMSIEMRVQQLLSHIDPAILTTATVINRRLKLPLSCQVELTALKNQYTFDHPIFKEKFLSIEKKFFGALESY